MTDPHSSHEYNESRMRPSLNDLETRISFGRALRLSAMKVAAETSGENPDEWEVYESHIDAYAANSFLGIIGNNPLSHRIGKRAQEADRPLVIVDLMATTAGVRSLAQIVNDKFERQISGISVSLTYDRSGRTKKIDDSLGITHITGDLGRGLVWAELKNELRARTVDYLLSAGIGGINTLPKHRIYYAGVLRRMWRMLNPEDGTMVLEIPRESFLQQAGLPGIHEICDAWIARDICAVASTGPYHSALYIERKPDDPVELPECGKLT